MPGLPFYLLKLLLTFFFSYLSCPLKWDLISGGKWKRSDFHYCNYYRYASSIIWNGMNLHHPSKAESSSLAFLLPPLLNPHISDFSTFLDIQVPKRPFLSVEQNILCCAIGQKRKLPFKSNCFKEKCGGSYSRGRQFHSQINQDRNHSIKDQVIPENFLFFSSTWKHSEGNECKDAVRRHRPGVTGLS